MLVLGILCGVASVIVAPTIAGAQDGDGAFQGTITVEDADGERIGVEGVRFIATTTDGDQVAEATTAADGTFRMTVPPGDYMVAIDVDSIPEGVTMRNPDRPELGPLSVQSGQDRNVLFPLIGGDAPVAEEESSGRITGLIVDGIIFGLIVAMCSIGLSLIFGTTGLTNFAHGELVTFGAVIALVINQAGAHVIVAAVIAIALSLVAGAANEFGIWRPLRRRGTGLIAMLVVSIGLSILARYLFLYFIGGRRETYNQYSLQLEGYDFLGITIVPRQLWIIGISLVALVLTALAVQKTKTGKAMRAVADNRDLAESSGINVERVILIVWVAGAGLAGLGGVLFGLNQGVSWNMGFELLLLMFAAVTLGGLGTAYGPLLGSVIVGLFINVSTLFVSSEIKNVGAFLILGVILLVRPQGILGRKERVG